MDDNLETKSTEVKSVEIPDSPDQLPDTPPNAPKKRRGRPPKSAIAAKKKGNRGKVGRPKGDAAIMNEYKAMMLASPKSEKIIQKVMDAALDDEHKHQGIAWKLFYDRMLPVAAFEKDVKSGRGIPQINVNIRGVQSVEMSSSEDIEDGEIIE